MGISTMQHIMWLAKRDVLLGVVDDDEYKNLRAKKHGKLSEALLRRLTVERYNRTKNERKVCKFSFLFYSSHFIYFRLVLIVVGDVILLDCYFRRRRRMARE